VKRITWPFGSLFFFHSCPDGFFFTNDYVLDAERVPFPPPSSHFHSTFLGKDLLSPPDGTPLSAFPPDIVPFLRQEGTGFPLLREASPPRKALLLLRLEVVSSFKVFFLLPSYDPEELLPVREYFVRNSFPR